MDLHRLLNIIKRWLLVIVAVVLATLGLATWRVATADTMYEASVKLQITAPQSEDVTIYDGTRAVMNVREQMTVARNNFGEILQSREIYERTARQLGLTGDAADYELTLRPLGDSDFLMVVVRDKNSEMVGQIVNTHVNSAINYYGEVRAKPSLAAKSFLAEQVATADKRVRTAESALSDFQIQNRVTNVANDMAATQKVLEQLLIERNRRSLEGPTSRAIVSAETVRTQLRLDRELANAEGNFDRAARLDQAILSYTEILSNMMQAEDNTVRVDELIAESRAELMRLAGLQPRYNTLQVELDQARAEYQQLVAKYTEALLKEQTVQAASFIQVIEPGIAPIQPVSTHPAVILILAVIASLIIGVVLAFVLDFLFPPTDERPVVGGRAVDVSQTVGESGTR